MDQPGAVVTDSGGIQEKTMFLGVPCITLRSNAERLVEIPEGINELMELVPDAIARGVVEQPNGPTPKL